MSPTLVPQPINPQITRSGFHRPAIVHRGGHVGSTARWLFRAARVALIAMAALSGSVHAQDVPEALQACSRDPAAIRDESVYRALDRVARDVRTPTLTRIAKDGSLAWDVRAHALTLLRAADSPDAFQSFCNAFDAIEVAVSPEGAAAVNILAAWLPEAGAEHDALMPLLLPGPDRRGVPEVLQALAGHPAHEYLQLLLAVDLPLAPESIRAVAETDDEATRRLLCWYVGDRMMIGMEDFLVQQIQSRRPCSYPSQARRLFEAAFTAGLSELIRAVARTPEWMAEDTTPKSLALSSLARLTPPGREIDAGLARELLREATVNAPGKDRAQWQLAGDIVLFLHQRGVELGPAGLQVATLLARQSLRKRGPLEAFTLANRLHCQGVTPLPDLLPDERSALWDITLTTLDADFMESVSQAYPDPARRQQLEQHLMGMAEKAGSGSLRVVRCWGADLQGPGEWCECVARLGLTQAIPWVEKVLDTSWPDEAVEALVMLGPAGAPGLASFLRSKRVTQLDAELRISAIQHCARHLAPDDARGLVSDLLTNSALRSATEEALRDMGPQGQSILLRAGAEPD